MLAISHHLPSRIATTHRVTHMKLFLTRALSRRLFFNISKINDVLRLAVNANDRDFIPVNSETHNSPRPKNLAYIPSNNSCSKKIVATRNKSAIIFIVAKSFINAINSKTLFPLNYRPRKEANKRAFPFITDFNALISVPLKALYIRIVASLNHAIPHFIKRMVALSVSFRCNTAAAFGFLASKSLALNGTAFSTIALAFPKPLSKFILMRQAIHRKLAYAYAAKVNEVTSCLLSSNNFNSFFGSVNAS